MTAHATEAVPEWALPLLRCPRCSDHDKGKLGAADESLVCGAGHRWPIQDGVPLFVPDEAYVGSFGFQWNRFNVVQLDTAPGGESERTLAEKTGLRPEDVDGKTVLDVGCGMGRFSEVVSRWGGRVVGVDLSEAVFAAHRNLADRENVTILQADAFRLPLRDGAFDVAFSIGVLHHTPDTRGAFLQIPPKVKAGGRVSIWVYSKRLQRIHPGSEILRPLTSRMDPERLLGIIRRWEPRLYKARRFPRVVQLVRAVVPTSAHPDPEWRILDTFDWYSPRYQWKHTDEEVERWFGEAGLTEIRHGPFPVSVWGARPF